MTISIIAAIGRNREIGGNNELLWHLPNDMQFFKDTTENHHVIMGRRNYDSIPSKYRPLPHRTNVIITRNSDFEAAECYICTTMFDALQIARENEETEAFVIGGGQIYEWALRENLVDRMYITHVDGEFPDADTFFPAFDPNEWEVTQIMEQFVNPSHLYSFVVKRYDRKPISEWIASDK
jgi:dihydrofolate reductase